MVSSTGAGLVHAKRAIRFFRRERQKRLTPKKWLAPLLPFPVQQVANSPYGGNAYCEVFPRGTDPIFLDAAANASDPNSTVAVWPNGTEFWCAHVLRGFGSRGFLLSPGAEITAKSQWLYWRAGPATPSVQSLAVRGVGSTGMPAIE